MHQGTPIIVGDMVFIYHGGGSEGSSRIKVFDTHISSKGKMRILSLDSLKSYHKNVTTLDGNKFDPRSLITHNWRKIISPELVVTPNFKMFILANYVELSKWLHLLDIKPSNWPTSENGAFRMPLDEWPPMRCYISKYREVYNEEGLGIEPGYSTLSIKRISKNDLSRCILYDPNVEVQQWQKDTVMNIERLIQMYHERIGKNGVE
jgi:hypothetical protein